MIVLETDRARKPQDQWTILGQPVPRIEIPAMATGQFEYVHNVRVPGMLHGQVIRPPFVGATLDRVDEDSVKGMPGLVKVVIEEKLRRRRRRETLAGDSGREQIESHVVAGCGLAELRELPRNAPDSEAHA